MQLFYLVTTASVRACAVAVALLPWGSVVGVVFYLVLLLGPPSESGSTARESGCVGEDIEDGAGANVVYHLVTSDLDVVFDGFEEGFFQYRWGGWISPAAIPMSGWALGEFACYSVVEPIEGLEHLVGHCPSFASI